MTLQQEPSPEKSQPDMQQQRSFGARCKELVIDCISPNTKQVRLSTRSLSSPQSSRPTAKVLFSGAPIPGVVSEVSPKAEESSRWAARQTALHQGLLSAQKLCCSYGMGRP